jgi:hypothetical protein
MDHEWVRDAEPRAHVTGDGSLQTCALHQYILRVQREMDAAADDRGARQAIVRDMCRRVAAFFESEAGEEWILKRTGARNVRLFAMSELRKMRTACEAYAICDILIQEMVGVASEDVMCEWTRFEIRSFAKDAT